MTPEKDWTVAEHSSTQFISPYTDITESFQAVLQQSLLSNGMCHVYYKNTAAAARAYQFSQTESVLVQGLFVGTKPWLEPLNVCFLGLA